MCARKDLTSLEDDIMRRNEEFLNELNLCESSADRHVTLCIHVVPSSLSDGSHLQTMTCVCFQSGGPNENCRGA